MQEKLEKRIFNSLTWIQTHLFRDRQITEASYRDPNL